MASTLRSAGRPPHTMARVDVIRVKGGARLAGDVTVVGAKNSALKLMAAALLRRGPQRGRQRAPDHRHRDHGRGAAPARLRGVAGRRRGRPSTCPAEPGSEADYDLVRRLRASICVLGPLLARRGYVRVALPGRRRDRLARAGHARLRPGPDGRRDLRRARLRHRLGAGRAARRDDLAGLPERRRDREPADGGRAGQGRHGDRQRGPRAGDRRHLRRCSPRWAPGSTAPARRRCEIEGVDELRAGAAHHGRRPDRRRHLGVRRGDDPRRRHRARGPTRRSWRSRWTSWSRPARWSSPATTRSGYGWTTVPRRSTS